MFTRGLDNNYCRNPDNERMPWCYTTDNKTRWEYCSVPTCGDGPRPGTVVVSHDIQQLHVIQEKLARKG